MKTSSYRLAFWLLPRLPARLTRMFAVAIGTIMWLMLPGMRVRVRAKLAHIPTLVADPQRLQRVTRQSFVHLILNYVDLFDPPAQRWGAAFSARFPVANDGELAAVLARGQGVIILAYHTDTFEAATYRIVELARGRRLVAPAEALAPPDLYAMVRAQRERSGMEFPPINEGATLRTMIAALRAGDGVLLALDRDVQQSGMTLPLFGAPSRIPIGPVALSRLTGAPILFSFPWREGLMRYHGQLIVAHAPIDATTRGDAAVRAALEPLIAVLEEQIMAHPEQWLAVFANDVWDVEVATLPTAPIPTAAPR